MAQATTVQRPEWGTFVLIVVCYAMWAAAVFWISGFSILLGLIVATLTAALHSSLTHEVLHGHPFRSKTLNESLVALPLTLFIPYNRFRDLHLAHHQDSNLTDPYDDPESNFLDPAQWDRFPAWKQALYRVNNTLLGRILVGPIIGQICFTRDEWRLGWSGDREVRLAWALHLPGVAIVLAMFAVSPMPVWVGVLSAYGALGILKIRTFLEHRAHEKSRARTVVIEDRGLLAFLFLNNNLHVVHHMNPAAAWYNLPGLYRRDKQRYLDVNDGYVYRSYAEIFRLYLLTPKDPVPHPLWRR